MESSSIWESLAASLGADVLGSFLNSPETKEWLSGFGFTPWSWYQDQEGWRRTQLINDQNFQYQSRINEQNFNNSVALWKMQNAYNSPAAQMQRYRDAGLNPNLIYGQQNLGASMSIPTMQNVERKSSGVPNGVGEFKNFMDTLSQLPFVKEKLDQSKQDTKIKKNTVSMLETQNDIMQSLMTIKRNEAIGSNLQAMYDNKLIANWNQIETYFLESVKEKFKEAKKKNELTDALRFLHNANKFLIDEKRKWFGGSPETGKGIWEFQRDLYDLQKQMGDIDLDWYKTGKWLNAISQGAGILGNFIKPFKLF